MGARKAHCQVDKGEQAKEKLLNDDGGTRKIVQSGSGRWRSSEAQALSWSLGDLNRASALIPR